MQFQSRGLLLDLSGAKMKTRPRARYNSQRRASLGAIYKEYDVDSPQESTMHIPAELVEATRAPRGFTHRRTSLPAVLQPPSLITMSERHFKEINEIIDDLLELERLSQPVLLSIKKVKKIMRPYERSLEMATNDCQADSENSEVELEGSWKTLTKRGCKMGSLEGFGESSRTLPKRSRPAAGNSLERLVEKDPASVFQSKLLPLSIRGSLGTSDYETDTTTAAEANFHDYLSSSQPKSTSYLLQPQSSRQLTRANFDALKRKSSGTFFALHLSTT